MAERSRIIPARVHLLCTLLDVFDYTLCKRWEQGDDLHLLEDTINDMAIYLDPYIDASVGGESAQETPPQAIEHLQKSLAATDEELEVLRRLGTALAAALNNLPENSSAKEVMANDEWRAVIHLARETFLLLAQRHHSCSTVDSVGR